MNETEAELVKKIAIRMGLFFGAKYLILRAIAKSFEQ